MDSLIDPIKRKWIPKLVDGLFVPKDAEIIKKIPLSRAALEDKLYWPYSSNRGYTYKSGYIFLKEDSELSISPLAQPD